MPAQVLYDSVSLQHLAVARLLKILEGIHGGRAEPRWVTVVRDEVANGVAVHSHCRDVLAFKWLGIPAAASDLKEVFRIQRALSSQGDAPSAHLGEAMSIVLAEELGGNFVTDDRAAYDYSYRRVNLGVGRVWDTCSLLDTALSVGEITQVQFKQAHVEILAAARHLRKCKCAI